MLIWPERRESSKDKALFQRRFPVALSGFPEETAYKKDKARVLEQGFLLGSHTGLRAANQLQILEPECSLMSDAVMPENFPLRIVETLRYSDTDRQGHVNNAVFSTLLESGRVNILYDQREPLAADGCAFVIARLEIDFLAELNWPGVVDVATAVARIGRSSLEIRQALFQNNECAAVSRSVIVQMNETTRRSQDLDEKARVSLQRWLVGDA